MGDIWVDVLDLDEIGVYDDFMELGGDSLRAGQVISRVVNTFRVELALSILFEAGTVADMAVAIVQGQIREVDQLDIHRIPRELEPYTQASSYERSLSEEV